MYALTRPLLFSLSPERAHNLVMGSLAAAGPLARLTARLTSGTPDPALATEIAGLKLPSPVGLAAGLDKDGRLIPFWPALGFGFIEVGTVTAHPQAGNPKPRMFRFPEQRALINRMGFNNQGSAALAERLKRLRESGPELPVPLGVNLGKSKITPLEDAVEDYAISTERVARYADYLVINVSSPNTPGLRSLQGAETLGEIVAAVVARREGRPVFVKLAPDLTFEALDEAVAVAEDNGAEGIIATNTTIERHGITEDVGNGGLSGAPLRPRALEVVRHVVPKTKLPVIAVGGISTAAHVLEALEAGAKAVQIYSALIFEGPGLVKRLNRGIADGLGPGLLKAPGDR
ncbi:MAG: quinone-dependent dihydroorotate dehydrogenase [Bradymonadia bacterium]